LYIFGYTINTKCRNLVIFTIYFSFLGIENLQNDFIYFLINFFPFDGISCVCSCSSAILMSYEITWLDLTLTWFVSQFVLDLSFNNFPFVGCLFVKLRNMVEIEMVNDICLLFLRMAYVKDNLHRFKEKII